MKTWGLFFLLLGSLSLTTLADKFNAARGVLARTVPTRAAEFVFQEIPAENGLDVFEILGGAGGRIIIRGNTTLALTSGFNWYLKHVAKCQISWNGDQLDLPTPLPAPVKKIRRISPTKHGFYFNYCTFNYTMSWWDWSRWEREIDYMALCGIDMPLAIVGTEALWFNFLKRFGYSSAEAREFIAGSGYSAWWLMGNLEGRGGPVTEAWIARQVKLQRKILARMRSLGMHPVQPGFVGLVPSMMSEKCGVKTLPQGRWAGGHIRPPVLDPADPKFDEMARAWYEELDKLYGKADVFCGDLFHEGGKTHGLKLGPLGARIQKYMLDYNPNAIWTLQAWGGNPKRALLEDLDKKHVLVVDLCNEFWRKWEKNKGFYNTPWIFSTIIMYGGNVGFHGRLDSICANLNAALKSKTPPVGLGATWESIEVNPVVIDYLWDMKWRTECPPPEAWAQNYAVRRYGFDSPEIREAWATLVRTVYGSYPGLRRPQESLLCAVPSLNVRKASPYAATCKIYYNPAELRKVLRLLLTASNACEKQRTYRFDIVDVTRQFVANVGQILYRDMIAAYRAKDLPRFQTAATRFLELLDDQDRILGCEPQYMLGTWLHQARAVAPNLEQANQNEKNARWLITTWSSEKTGLNNYAWREWNGLMRNYYKPRWELFINSLKKELSGEKVAKPDYYPSAKAWCLKTLKDDPYPTTPQGDPIKIANELLAKYGSLYDAKTAAPSHLATRNDFVGAWEYSARNAIWRRVLHADGRLELMRNGKVFKEWVGATWVFDPKTHQAILYKRGKNKISTAELLPSGKVRFTGGWIATKIETGKNTEAQEAAKGTL